MSSWPAPTGVRTPSPARFAAANGPDFFSPVVYLVPLHVHAPRRAVSCPPGRKGACDGWAARPCRAAACRACGPTPRRSRPGASDIAPRASLGLPPLSPTRQRANRAWQPAPIPLPPRTLALSINSRAEGRRPFSVLVWFNCLGGHPRLGGEWRGAPLPNNLPSCRRPSAPTVPLPAPEPWCRRPSPPARPQLAGQAQAGRA